MNRIRAHYDILGLGPDCTIDEVKKAHLDLTMLLQHQQVFKSNHAQRFRSYLDESYQVLSDPDWRDKHRQTLEGVFRRLEMLEEENMSLKTDLHECHSICKALQEENRALRATLEQRPTINTGIEKAVIINWWFIAFVFLLFLWLLSFV